MQLFFETLADPALKINGDGNTGASNIDVCVGTHPIIDPGSVKTINHNGEELRHIGEH
jgi:hypothetical protein